jgi:hypothetical protein
MTSPVMQALVSARLAQANEAEAGFRTFVFEKLGKPPGDVRPPPEFEAWCESKSVPAC